MFQSSPVRAVVLYARYHQELVKIQDIPNVRRIHEISFQRSILRHSTQELLFLCCLCFFVILIRTAWITDDAAITLRTVLNFVHGFGPTFNIDERVQAYTHPFWFLLLSLGALIFGNVYVSTFVVSISASMASIGLLLGKFTKNVPSTILLLLALILSKAFIDFSTSGLENPLSHLLSIAIILLVTKLKKEPKKDLTLFFLCCSLLYLNRADLILIITPLAILVFIEHLRYKRLLIKSLSIASIPIITWTCFSLYYYGFIFPNTAYAKLDTGIPQSEIFVQGFKYILHNIYRDPLTIFWIVSGLFLGFRGSDISKALSVGVSLYIAYIISIGGDFMEGRLFTVPFLLASIIIAKELVNKKYIAYMTAAVLALGIFSIKPNILSGSHYSHVKIYSDGIADERGYYFQRYGLLAAPKSTFARPEWTVKEHQVRIICGGLGFSSIYKGPGMHYIDTCGLADPLLARLPARHNRDWRIGHFVRQLPVGYVESVKSGENLIKDPKIKAYYDLIRTITRGPLNSSERIMKIIKINLTPF